VEAARYRVGGRELRGSGIDSGEGSNPSAGGGWSQCQGRKPVEALKDLFQLLIEI
jgi:hypothetical protein